MNNNPSQSPSGHVCRAGGGSGGRSPQDKHSISFPGAAAVPGELLLHFLGATEGFYFLGLIQILKYILKMRQEKCSLVMKLCCSFVIVQVQACSFQ